MPTIQSCFSRPTFVESDPTMIMPEAVAICEGGERRFAKRGVAHRQSAAEQKYEQHSTRVIFAAAADRDIKKLRRTGRGRGGSIGDESGAAGLFLIPGSRDSILFGNFLSVSQEMRNYFLYTRHFMGQRFWECRMQKCSVKAALRRQREAKRYISWVVHSNLLTQGIPVTLYI